MKATILHDSNGRMRIKIHQDRLTMAEADLMESWFQRRSWAKEVKVHERTNSVIIYYKGERQAVIDDIISFNWNKAEECTDLVSHSSREINAKYKEKLVMKVAKKAFSMLFLPKPLKIVRCLCHMLPFVKNGLHCVWRRQMKVELLDAISVSASAITGDFATAGTVMFLLEVGELLEEWTRKKSMDDLARSMSLQIEKVWLQTESGEVLVPISQVHPGDRLIVRAGSMIPMDGVLRSGEVTVNQASLTGESIPVEKRADGMVYAGTVVEEGECCMEVIQAQGESRYDRIVKMIEKSEQLKSASESKAAHLADKLVPYTFLGSIGSLILTGMPSRALSVLMVDFSCALKLAMPLAVLSAMREASREQITVKGGKFLEAFANADTIVFDKTGTLTYATPKVVRVVPFGNQDENEMLRLAACLEEHFPHSMATAVVEAAKERNLDHEELHTKVEYLVAHGISSTVNGERVVIGSYHFVFEDEKCIIPDGEESRFDLISKEYSRLFLALNGRLAAVICIADPLRQEAKAVLEELRELGVENLVMLTGDSKHTAATIAKEVGVDQFCAEVLPADKADYVAKMKAEGHTVAMVGDGINDSPALSAADVGIAISDGAAIAREIADITIAADSLQELVGLRVIAMSLMKRIRANYRYVIGVNSSLIALGVAGVLTPAASATFHNLSTLDVSLRSMKALSRNKEKIISKPKKIMVNE